MMKSSRHRGFSAAICCCISLLCLFARGEALAQEIAIPVDVHMSLLAKVLAYDRSFPGQDEKDVVLGIVHQCTWKPSLEVARDVKQFILDRRTVMGERRVRVISIAVTNPPDLKASLEYFPITVIYFAPLQGLRLQDLLEITRPRQIRTITGVAEYVEDGVAIGIGERDFRPLILVNLQAARAEGADLSAQVLQFAKVIP